jgi:hypothetical protein
MRPVRHLIAWGAMMLALTACGGIAAGNTTPTLPTLSDTARDGSATTSTTEAVDPEVAFQEYTTCMREHGVEMPDPATDGGGIVLGGDDFDLEVFEEASTECDPILEAAFGEFEMIPEMEAEMRDQELAFAQCMRENGIEDWPDPGTDGSNMIELGDGIDPEEVEPAIEKCSQEIFGDLGGVIVGGEVAP